MQNILNKLHKFTSAQEPMKVEFSKLDEIISKMKESGMDAAAADDMKRQAIIKYQKAISKDEQNLKELAYMLDVATEIGATNVVSDVQKKMGEVRNNLSYYEKQIQKLKG